MRLKTKKFGVPEAKGRHVATDLARAPSPSVMAEGIAGVGQGQYWLEPGPPLANRRADRDKPPYRVPSMAEIAATPKNGLLAASTFSGCGGSCLGLEMAGFHVAWANEFLPVAALSHKANFPGCLLDLRDVKAVQPQEILDALKIERGRLDLLDGSPPCQAFSTAGRRAKGWGKERRYEHGATQKNEDLFYEFVRILEGLAPRAFVAENVAGLARGVAKGYFLDILARLKAAGYRVEARLLDAQWLGVPQARPRIFFVGARLDLPIAPVFPKPLPYRYSVADAIPETFGPKAWIKIENDHVRQREGSEYPRGAHFRASRPAPSVEAGGMYAAPAGMVRVVLDEGYRKCKARDFAVDPMVTVRAGQNSVKVIPKAAAIAGSFEHYVNKRDVTKKPMPALLTAQPNHYFVQGDGSDATRRDDRGQERRRFSIAELRRICAFPDDFALRGTYSQQWAQLGNAVPPVMMAHVARGLAAMLSAQKT